MEIQDKSYTTTIKCIKKLKLVLKSKIWEQFSEMKNIYVTENNRTFWDTDFSNMI